MLGSLTFFSLSKCKDFQAVLEKKLKTRWDLYQFNTFAKFLTNAICKKPHVIVVDYKTANLTDEVLELFCENEFSFLSCAVVVCEEELDIKSNKFLFARKNELDNCISEAAIMALKSEISKTGKKEDEASSNIIMDVLTRLGFSKKHIGTMFLHSAIETLNHNDCGFASFNKNLYPILAKKFNTVVNNIERNIRNSIKEAYKKTGKITFENFLGIYLGKDEFPPSRTFITTICHVLSNNEKVIRQKLLA